MTFTTLARVYLSWLVSPASLHTASSLSNNYECYRSMLFREGGYAWWVSRDSTKMTYWGGASPGSDKCACGMNNSCADPSYGCNCDANDNVWREDSGLLTDKTKLPVKQLRFGDTVNNTTLWESLSVMVLHTDLFIT